MSEGTGNRGRIEGLVESLLKEIGEDPGRPGLQLTPRRVANALTFFTHGYRVDPREVLSRAIFEDDYDEMVVVRDIDFYSMCEHHVLPFFGRAHLAYIPDGRIVGLSKLARLVEIFARRLQVQERLTNEIARALWEVVRPKGVAVVLEAQHLCMQMRGVEKQNSYTITSSMLGEFEANSKTRTEFMELIRHRR